MNGVIDGGAYRLGTGGRILSLLLSAGMTWGVFWFFGVDMQLTSLLLVTAGVYCLACNAVKIRDRRTVIVGGVMGGLLALCLVVGGKIIFPNKEFLPFSLADIGWFLLLALFFYTVSVNLSLLADKAVIQRFGEEVLRGKKAVLTWLIGAAALCICWLPTFLTYYPGCLTPDSLLSISQSMGDKALSNHHPVLFTMVVKVFVQIGRMIGKPSVGVGLFSLFQMAVMSGILSYGLYWLMRHRVPKLPVIFAGLYFVLSQVFPLYAISMWKDVLFGGVLLLLCLYLYDVWESHGERLGTVKGLLHLVVLAILACFLRNNGVYVVFVLLVVLAVYYRKFIKKTAPVFAAVMALVLIIQGPVYNALGIEQSAFEEAAGIPLQQIGRTVAMDGKMTEEQKAYLERVMPLERIKSQYDPYTSNLLKFDETFDSAYFNETKGEFLKTWAQMLFPNFKHYVKAYLMETQGYWHPTTKDWIVAMPEYTGDPYGITSTDWVYVATGRSLKEYMEEMTDFLSIGAMVWITVFCVGVMVAKKQKGKWLFALPLFLLWGTNMIAAPTYCEFRYMFSFALALPFVIAAMLMKREPETEK